VAAEPEVFGLVHYTHATAAELLQNAIVADGFADHPSAPDLDVEREC
jgi:hypothetical protein